MSSPATSERVLFTEVGPRDGLQNLPENLSTQQKLELVKGSLDSGFDLVEATSFVSPKWVPKMSDAEALTSALVAERGSESLGRIRVLVPNRQGLDRALGVGVRRALVNVGVTDSFNRRNLNRSTRETVAEISEVAKAAETAGTHWDASLSVAFGCPYEGRVDPQAVCDLADELFAIGAYELSLADTIGVADPAQVVQLVGQVGERVPISRISLHLHDTRGMALANALWGYQAGVRRFEGSVGGIGGCPFAPRSTGNVCSEDLAYLLERVGAQMAVNVERACALAQWLEGLLGRELPGRLYRAGIWGATTAS